MRICSEFERDARLLLHPPVVERVDEPRQPTLLDLAAEEDVGADVEIVGEREVLINRLDAVAARIHRRRERDRRAVEDDLAVVGLVDSRHTFDQRRLARAVVAEQADDLAAPHLQAHAVDRRQPAETLAQVADLQQRVGHCAAPRRCRPMMRSRD